MLYGSGVQILFVCLINANWNAVVLTYTRMAFDTGDFHFLFFWTAVTNALIYWELLHYHNALHRFRFHKITQGHWVVYFFPKPASGRRLVWD